MTGFKATLAIALIAGAGLKAQDLPDPQAVQEAVEQAKTMAQGLPDPQAVRQAVEQAKIMAEDAKRQAVEMRDLDAGGLAEQARMMAEDAKRQAAEMRGMSFDGLSSLKLDLGLLALQAPRASGPTGAGVISGAEGAQGTGLRRLVGIV